MTTKDFNDSDFDDIRPYRDEEFRTVVRQITKDQWTITTLRRFFWPKCPNPLIPILEFVIRNYLQLKLLRVRTVDDFHKRFMKKMVLEYIKKRTMTRLTYTGIEHVSREKASLFITNHRDITLDPAFICYVLLENGFKTPEIAFGDNLLLNEFMSNFIRINKSFIVRRNLPLRQQLKQSLHLSNYIQYTLSRNVSIWLAQRGGRAKDGDDRTNPSIIKMLYLSQRKKGMSFSDYINNCNIVPVAISYEFDPCDQMKAREVYRIRTRGSYEKREREDLISILKGINEDKGRVHFTFCEPLQGDWVSAREVASEIDRRINAGYKLWPTNYIAYDFLFATFKYSNQYTKEEREAFLQRFKKLSQQLLKVVMEIYARPVMNKERLLVPHTGT
jgi:hypothetical protein